MRQYFSRLVAVPPENVFQIKRFSAYKKQALQKLLPADMERQRATVDGGVTRPQYQFLTRGG
jgi:hypothetical protein